MQLGGTKIPLPKSLNPCSSRRAVPRGAPPSPPAQPRGTWGGGPVARSSPPRLPGVLCCRSTSLIRLSFPAALLGNNGRPCAGRGCPSPSLQLARPPVLSSSEQDRLKHAPTTPMHPPIPLHPSSRACLSTGAAIGYTKHLVRNGLFVLEGRGLSRQRAVILGRKSFALC